MYHNPVAREWSAKRNRNVGNNENTATHIRVAEMLALSEQATANCSVTAHQTRSGEIPLAILRQLGETQWWPASQIRSLQFRRLRHLLRHAQRSVPYYRNRLNKKAVESEENLSQAWSQIPLLCRRDIQNAGDALTSDRILDRAKTLRQIVTSGSTGEPVCVLQTPRVRYLWRAFTMRDHLWHRRDLRVKLAVIRYVKHGGARPPEGQTYDTWGEATAGVMRTGPAALLSIDSTSGEQMQWLREQNPQYLLTYPSNACALAHAFRNSGQRITNLRELRTIGEVVTPEARRLCAEVFHVPLVDVYTAQEVGYIALQCPEHGNYHIQSENLLVEILNEQGNLCGPGEVGRVVVTTLHNFATPLIRYAIGDYARVGKVCSCGRSLPVLEQIMGRSRNMIMLPNGERRWPALGEVDDISRMPAFQQFQVIQRSLTDVEVKVVVPRPFSNEQELVVRESLRKTLGYPFQITITYVDEISRSSSGKFEDFKSDLDDLVQPGIGI
jgi:phenylacetate-coenzyme A ligase PaaK-like adenylate-forming protein